MKDSYNKSIDLRCISCGDSNFEFNEDKSWLKCNCCGKEYNGYDELVELNQETIKLEIEKTKEEIGKDLQRELNDTFKKSFKGNKNIKFR